MSLALEEVAVLLKTEKRFVRSLIKDKVLVARKDGKWQIEEASIETLRRKFPWRLSLQYFKQVLPLREIVESLATIQWSHEWADTHMSAALGISEKHWMRMRNHQYPISRPTLKKALKEFPELERLF